MAPSNCCRSVLASGAILLAGCGDQLGPDAIRRADAVEMRIEGFPPSGAIRRGESVLLSLRVETDVESIAWTTSDAAVVSVIATPSVSPCGSACAWARGESAGTARLAARVCFADGSCAEVQSARVSGRDVPTQMEVLN